MTQPPLHPSASSGPKPVVFRLFNNLEVGGVTSRLRQVLPLLLDEFDVHMVTYRKEGVLGPEFREKGIHVHHVPLRGKWNPSGLRALAALFREHRADVVHTHAFGGNVSGILAAAMAGVPVRLGQVHTRHQHWYGKTELHKKKQRLEEYLIHKFLSHKVIFPSRAALDYFHAHCPVAADKLYVLHNGVRLPEDPDPALPSRPGAMDPAVRELRQRFGIPPRRRVLGFVGRLAGGKGLGFAFSFVQRLREAGHDYCLLVVGSSGKEAMDSSFREQAAVLGEELVYFAGAQSDPYPFYHAFDAFFFSSESWTEAMPGTALEAAAHGLPVLSRENPAMREIAEYYDGIHFMHDDDEPAEAIAALEALPVADTRRLKENFSIQAMADKTKKLYRGFLRRE